MHLYLIRHGNANPPGKDPSKDLSDFGKSQSEKIGEYLKFINVKVELISHSDKARAISTAKILNKHLGSQLSQSQNLAPNDSVDEIVLELESNNSDQIIVGHLPYLSNLASSLLYKKENPYSFDFPELGTLSLEKISTHWQVKWFISPETIQ